MRRSLAFLVVATVVSSGCSPDQPESRIAPDSVASSTLAIFSAVTGQHAQPAGVTRDRFAAELEPGYESLTKEVLPGVPVLLAVDSRTVCIAFDGDQATSSSCLRKTTPGETQLVLMQPVGESDDLAVIAVPDGYQVAVFGSLQCEVQDNLVAAVNADPSKQWQLLGPDMEPWILDAQAVPASTKPSRCALS